MQCALKTITLQMLQLKFAVFATAVQAVAYRAYAIYVMNAQTTNNQKIAPP